MIPPPRWARESGRGSSLGWLPRFPPRRVPPWLGARRLSAAPFQEMWPILARSPPACRPYLPPGLRSGPGARHLPVPPPVARRQPRTVRARQAASGLAGEGTCSPWLHNPRYTLILHRFLRTQSRWLHESLAASGNAGGVALADPTLPVPARPYRDSCSCSYPRGSWRRRRTRRVRGG